MDGKIPLSTGRKSISHPHSLLPLAPSDAGRFGRCLNRPHPHLLGDVFLNQWLVFGGGSERGVGQEESIAFIKWMTGSDGKEKRNGSQDRGRVHPERKQERIGFDRHSHFPLTPRHSNRYFLSLFFLLPSMHGLSLSSTPFSLSASSTRRPLVDNNNNDEGDGRRSTSHSTYQIA